MHGQRRPHVVEARKSKRYLSDDEFNARLAKLYDHRECEARVSAEDNAEQDWEVLKSMNRRAIDSAPFCEAREAKQKRAGTHVKENSLREALIAINWRDRPERLIQDNISHLQSQVANALHQAAERDDIKSLASSLKVEPVVLVIGLLAKSLAKDNKHANRVARRIFELAEDSRLETLRRDLGLTPPT